VSEKLGRGGTVIVSGGAFGVDAAAHEGALASGAATFAVLGCGVDVVYPDRHASLFSRIVAKGGLLSEYSPGTPPRAGQFPARNRILAALCDAVIVIEAASRSGSLITARLGRALGRPVYALPGSSGTDAMLREGTAKPLSMAADSLETLLGSMSPSGPRVKGPLAVLIAALAEGKNSPVELVARLKQPLSSILALLSEAELEGFVRRVGGNYYEVMGRGSD
jgi:DNA processing protein